MNSVRSSIPDALRPAVRLFLSGLLAFQSVPFPLYAKEAPASGDDVSIDAIEIGLKGQYKVGEWAPLWVTLRSPETRRVTIVVDVPDSDDNLTSLPRLPVDVQAGSPVRCETSFRTGRLNGELQVRVEDAAGDTLATRRLRAGNDAHSEFRPALRLDRRLWITLGNLNLGGDAPAADDAGARAASSASEAAREPRIVSLESLQELPGDARSLQSLDLLVLPTGRRAGASQLDHLTDDCNNVLQKWVRGGGHLLLSIGSDSATYRESPLAKWDLPFVVEGPLPLRQLSTLEAFAGQHAPLKFAGTLTGARLGRLPAINVIVRHAGTSQPLVAGVAYGFGRVTIVGVDIDAPPLSNWTALKSVLEKLAGSKAPAAAGAAAKHNQQLTHVGVTDLATQFQQTQEDFPEVRRPSYWWVMGLILIYVAVIGPVDYLFVQRLARRPELTWLTFPILVVLAFAAAAWEADRANRRDLLVNQFDLLDIDAVGNSLRARTWVSLYSPEHRRFSVAVEPELVKALGSGMDTTPADLRVSWMSPPENSVAGLYRSGAASFGGRGYRFAPASTQVENLPVAQWSTKCLAAAWTDDLPQSLVDCRLETFGAGQLKGTFAHHLPRPLEDCLLVVGGWAYIPTTPDATLKPNVDWRPVGNAVRQRDLKALLTGEQQMRRGKEGAQDSGIATTTEIYDPLSRDRRRQVRLISFHEAIGGSEYTGLANAEFRDLELTNVMQLGRGVLIGRLPAAAAQVLIDGRPAQPAQQATWVRLVFPVLQSDRAVEKTIPNLNDQLRGQTPPSGNSP